MRVLYYAKELEASSTKQAMCIWFWQYARKGKPARKSRMYLLRIFNSPVQPQAPPAQQKLQMYFANAKLIEPEINESRRGKVRLSC